MRTNLKRAAATSGVLGATMFAALGTAPSAQALDPIVHEFTAAEVEAFVRDSGDFTDFVCGWMQWPFADLCKQFAGAGANGGQMAAFQDAADHDCGIRQTVYPTGSGNSWDKADFKYQKINCN